MTKTGYKNIFIALLLLAFTSQSFAALTMPCQFVPQTSDTMNMAGMDHAKMGHPSQTKSSTSGDCCKTVGHCSTGSCSLAFFGNTYDLSLLSTHTDAHISYTSVVPESLVSSLFRPPIFC